MPQTDLLSFFSQYFWLSITLFTFIIMLSNTILPYILEIIFIRNKLKNNINTLSKSNIENKQLNYYFEKLTLNLIKINNKFDVNNNSLTNLLINHQDLYLKRIINLQLNNNK